MAAFETNIAGTSSVTPAGDVQAGGEKMDIKTDIKAEVQEGLKKVPEVTSDKSLLANPKPSLDVSAKALERHLQSILLLISLMI